MTKLVLMHKADSIYDDVPDERYDFPAQYLNAVREGIGDWVIYYEPGKGRRRAYFAAAKILDVIEKPHEAGRYLALIEPNSYLPFVQTVDRLSEGRPLESVLAHADGKPRSGGLVQSAVRRLPDKDFERIIRLGLPPNLEATEARRYDPAPSGLAETETIFERPIVELLSRRAYRDVAFRKNVREAYDYRCAMSGLRLRNGGGRPEVQAAHIRPVEHGGSDATRNGLALSGTLHWMFDRGLISVAEDCQTIMISHNKVPEDVVSRLIRPEGKLIAPRDVRDAPHPANLHWHRENVFGQFEPDGQAPWN